MMIKTKTGMINNNQVDIQYKNNDHDDEYGMIITTRS